MASNFLKAAMRPVSNVNSFLRDSADNSVKYKPESGKKHHLYIPYSDENDERGEIVKSIIAMSGAIHELAPAPDKYEAHVCLEQLFGPGECPYCDNVGKSWDIYRYKMDTAKARAEQGGMNGAMLDDYLKKCSQTYGSERKVKTAKPYIYQLVVQYKLGADNKPEIGPDGLPAFELKVMKLSDKGIGKIQQTFENANMEYEGAEVIFKYEQKDNPMLVAGSRTITPVFQGKLVDTYPALKGAIDAAVSKWSWEGIQKAFREWAEYDKEQALAKCEEMFHTWDEYVKNPAVGYLEDAKQTQTNNPALEQKAQPNQPVPTNMELGGQAAPNGFGGQVGGQAPQMGFGGMPDPNAIFGGGGPSLG